MMRLDAHLPSWDFREKHELEIRSSPEHIYHVLGTVDFNQSWVIRVLFALRGMAFLFRKSQERRLTLARITSNGFVLLDEDPPVEVVIGLVGRFWKWSGKIMPISPEEYPAFERAGFAKVAWNFLIRTVEDGRSVLSTETRIRCLDDASHRRFRRYWRLIRPFSGWIRKEMLKLVRQHVNDGNEAFKRVEYAGRGQQVIR